MENGELHGIRRIYETQLENGFRDIVLNGLSFEKLLERAEKVEELEKKLVAVSTFAQDETARYRDALEKIEIMSNGFAKSLAQKVLNDRMDES